MRKFVELDDSEKRRALGRKLVAAGVVVMAAGVYTLHRKKIMALGAEAREAIEWTMDNSFNEGVKYGLKLAKDIGLGAAEKSEYAFAAFDKAAG